MGGSTKKKKKTQVHACIYIYMPTYRNAWLLLTKNDGLYHAAMGWARKSKKQSGRPFLLLPLPTTTRRYHYHYHHHRHHRHYHHYFFLCVCVSAMMNRDTPSFLF